MSFLSPPPSYRSSSIPGRDDPTSVSAEDFTVTFLSPPPSYRSSSIPGRSNPSFEPDTDYSNSTRKSTTNPGFTPEEETAPKTLYKADSGDSREVSWGFRHGGKSEEPDLEESVGSDHHEQQMEAGSAGVPSTVGDPGDAKQDEKKIWDVFGETPWENLDDVDRQFWNSWYIASRIIACLFLFLCVLAASSASLLSVLLIIFNIDAAPHNYTLSNGQVLRWAGHVIDVRWVWAAMIVTSAPYVFTLFSCVYRLCVKRTNRPTLWPLLAALIVETLHSVGLGAFVLVVAPSYDPLMIIIMMQTVSAIPACVQCSKVLRQKVRFVLNVTALVSTLLCLTLLVYRLHLNHQNLGLTITTPVSLLLLSLKWWDNFVPTERSWKTQRKNENYQRRKDARKPWLSQNRRQTVAEIGSFLFRLKYAIRDSRTQIEAWCALWKIFLNLVIPIVVFAVQHEDCVAVLYYTSEKAENCSLFKLDLLSSGDGGWCQRYLPFVVAAVSIFFSGIAFKAAKVACKINAQKFCFALPLTLSAPMTFVVVVLTYRHGLRLGDCWGLKWPLLMGVDLVELVKTYTEDYWLVGLMALGWVAFSWTLLHVWRPSAERVASTDRLFVRRLYCGVLLGQSLMLNRAADDIDIVDSKRSGDQKVRGKAFAEKITRDSPEMIDQEKKNPRFPMIYACATMWHETPVEMTQLLKSLFRMDKDQFRRECSWRDFLQVDKDFYRFEAHIFFDDAFMKPEEGDYTVNDYVKTFTKAVYDAARVIYPSNVYFYPPIKTETPYGGRLTYILPGTNLMVVHLKNKHLIRNKKRWSQVMYMYYLLSYKLWLGEKSMGMKNKRVKNTFLLALDGDVHFHPEDVQLLVDRMNKDEKVGAACGRIHPIGSGLMVMYQKFEYAVSHWLQKATEHIFGCVLCSPGCFSLFRASDLMDNNVVRRYASVTTTARQAVQYDMGEDRWLCTLLLQQGKRVEYTAASDALTFCPESFQEFYNQRRRWTPSTMANILDLLTDWRHVTRVNDSISFLFIAYQIFLFVSSLVTPGTIFLLILAAFSTAYPSMPLYGALLVNLIPVVIFIVACFFASSDTQMTLAMGLSMLYSFLMMVVLVGLLKQVSESGMCSVTAIFFVFVAGVFVLAALLHPQEMTTILYGLLYFLAIPSMSMLLVFFAMANLNVVKWGTRDSSPQVASSSKGQRKQNADRKREEDLLTSEYTCSFGNLFKWMCCPTKQQNDEVMERCKSLKTTLEELEHLVRDDTEPDPEAAWTKYEKDKSKADNTRWFDRPELGSGDISCLCEEEERFWEQLIHKYLTPVDQTSPENKHKAEQMEKELTTLRNKTAMLFFIGNALFVAVIFILKTVSEYTPSLTLQLPCDHSDVGQKIEPISVTFTVVFGILLILQTVGMLHHRFSTFVHIVAATKVPFCSRKKKGDKDSAEAGDFDRYGYRETDQSNREPNSFLYLTENLIHRHNRRSSVSSTYSKDSGYSAYADSIRLDSSRWRTRHSIMPKLLERQKSMKQSRLHVNLYSVVNEGVAEMIKKLNPPEDGVPQPRRRDGDEGKSDESEATVSGDEEEERPGGGVIPAGLRWLKGHSLNAVLTLANDAERLKLVEQRTQAAQRWVDVFKNLKQKQSPRTVADFAMLVLQNKERLGKQTSGQEEDPDQKTDGSETMQKVAKATVTFKEEKDDLSATVPTPGPQRQVGRSRWKKVKAAEIAMKAARGEGTPTSDIAAAAPTTSSVPMSKITASVATSKITASVATSKITASGPTSTITASGPTSTVTASGPTSTVTASVPTSTVTASVSAKKVVTSADSSLVPSQAPRGLLKTPEADSPVLSGPADDDTDDVTEF